MDGRAGSEPDRQNNCCISTRKDTSYSILCSSSCRGNDPTSPQSPGSSSPWYDASAPYGGPSHDANDGPSSSWDDASGTCSWNEATYGRPHANDAWAPNDETSCPSHDGAHSARNDSTRQIRRDRNLFIFILYYLFTSPGDHGVVTLGVFSQQDKEDLLHLPIKERIVFAGK
ncbi:U1 small nuclear ribonucleoprotein C isoform X1 [Neomonachus schauinslandi]|uniref:U1 small nuclear ribonucleoprotein C isoform X1 n=1 Tax=Neomonachus schauinslandi TaxID=29088 RepID=A0A8M1MIJ0_NEOSC|nr:U1 small nuclear ribonucleoprotein C isoform X1 [Neomonachus schauinslandi]